MQTENKKRRTLQGVGQIGKKGVVAKSATNAKPLSQTIKPKEDLHIRI